MSMRLQNRIEALEQRIQARPQSYTLLIIPATANDTEAERLIEEARRAGPATIAGRPSLIVISLVEPKHAPEDTVNTA